MSVRKTSDKAFQVDALTSKVLNLDLTFHWVAGSDRFWFRRQTRMNDDFVMVDAETGTQLPAQRQTHPALPPHREFVTSPDGRYAVLCRENNLCLRDLQTKAERCLTHDGEPGFGYGDVDPSYDRQVVARTRASEQEPLRGVIWSPDGRFILALRQDLRGQEERLFVTEYVPPNGGYSTSHSRRISLPADPRAPDSKLAVFDTQTSTLRQLTLDPQAMNDIALHYLIEGVVWWSAAGERLYLIAANRGGTRYALHAVELATGVTREVLEETARFNVRLNPWDYARPNVYVTPSDTEIIWYSERSGYGHLYLYDAHTGELKRQLTSGNWVVFDLLSVDEAQRLVYFTAATRSRGGNPYYRYLYRVSLDGGEPELLTPEAADHKFSNLLFRGAYRSAGDGTGTPQPGSSISPSGRFFIDSFSTTEQPPKYVLRRTSGELIAELLEADASELYATGWRPPELVSVKASDGVTDLYGVLTKPRDFDPSRKYPVIDAMYPGPQGSYAPRTFVEQLACGPMYCSQVFADAGFIVIAIDGRGTARRSRAFRDAFLGTEDVFGAADHVAAIHQLMARCPHMDARRIGVMGQSFGGYGSLRAMLLFPDVFKVAVSATGPADYLDAEGQTNVERFFGVPGASVEARLHYDLISNTRLVSRLKGRVLLIYGGIDESVPLKHAMTIFDAFIKGDKDVDMLVVPDSAHEVPREPYVIRRTVQYFVEQFGRAAQQSP